MNLALSDNLETLRAQLVQAEQKLAVAAKAVKVAERAEERASGVVMDLREAIDFERLRRWGDHPDLAALMGSGSDGTMVFYRALDAIAQSKGFGIGGRWFDTDQLALRFSLNRGERGAVERIAQGVLFFAPAMKPIKGGARHQWVRFQVTHSDPGSCAWELRYAKKTFKARLVQCHYGTETEILEFESLLAALRHVEEHLWYENVIDEDTTSVLEDGTVVA